MKPLEAERKKIDKIDRQLLGLLQKRLSIAKGIVAKKSREAMPITDKKREMELKGKWAEKAKKIRLNRNMTLRILREVLDESRKIQTKELRVKK